MQRNTLFGVLTLLVRHLFALYCIYRIFASGWSNIRLIRGLPTNIAEEDPLSRILAILAKAWISTTKVPLDVDAYRRLISFILVGVVISGSVNAVVSTIQRVSKSAPLSPALTTLSISWISGTYFMSTAIMLRSNLPEKYVGGIGNALGTALSRGIFDQLFDVMFFVAAAVTVVALLLARSWNEETIELEGKEV